MKTKELELPDKNLVNVTIACKGCSSFDEGDGFYGSKVFVAVPHRTIIGSDKLIIEDEKGNSIPFERGKNGGLQTVALSPHWMDEKPEKAIFKWETYD